jgi:hypothetical protein
VERHEITELFAVVLNPTEADMAAYREPSFEFPKERPPQATGYLRLLTASIVVLNSHHATISLCRSTILEIKSIPGKRQRAGEAL